MKNLKFSKDKNGEFSKVLRERVNKYFKMNSKNIYGNKKMIFKTVFMLCAFFFPLIVINTGAVNSMLLLFILYICSGLGMAGVGMGVMHDAIHGSYSKNKTLNKYIGYTMNLIGANARVWKVQHNVLHHSYTNIDQADDDINAPFFLRFSPHAKRYWIHRFQFLYIWVFYGLSTISWITMKDFVRVCRYKKMGFFSKNKEFSETLRSIIAWKVFYYSYALVLPLVMVPLPAWIIILAFLSMHFVTGICISIVFQTAHIMPDTTFIKPDSKGEIEQNWTIHQMATTSNYSPNSRIFSWLIGGLNFQIEHHLFPNISHIHYRKLSGIVSKTASEFKIPYLVKDSFFIAIRDHIKMLYQLGKA